ncbi:MAG: discoidin domain-containing protein [Gammaproteobacteria bacterium]
MIGASAWLLLALATAPALSDGVRLDGFESLEPWRADASDAVEASIGGDAGYRGRGLRLDFDFSGVGGYAVARRALPLDFPPNFEISFYLRGAAPPNNLEIKLVDESGENVWWMNRANFEFPENWRQIRIKRRQIEFAWGPTKDRTLRRAATLEFVVSAGSGGGRGSVWFDELEFRARPVPTHPPPAPQASATSSRASAGPLLALDGNRATAWISDEREQSTQAYDIDLREPREFGGLVLQWLEGAHARRYDVRLSDDGVAWHTVRSIRDGNGGTDFLDLPESEARYVRLVLHESPSRRYGLADIEVQDLAFGASPNAFFGAIARAAPRGHYPRAFIGEQPYWTVLGVDGGDSEGLLSEDGALEVGKGSFTVEPFVIAGGHLVTWADVRTSHSLLDGYLPMPSVSWAHERFGLEISAFAAGTPESSRLVARYDVRNPADESQTLTLALAVRPFQVNPPSQVLNVPGGVSFIRRLERQGSVVAVNAERRLFTLAPPDAFHAAPFDSAGLAELAMRPPSGERSASVVTDPTGFASGVLLYRLLVPANGTATVGWIAPLDGAAAAPELQAMPARPWLDQEREIAAAQWRATLNHVTIDLPPQAANVENALRTALAHVLINRDGPRLQPGSRSYDRSWIRDGALTSAALLRLGHANVVDDFARWYSQHLFPNGKVPCCVDRRGADPVPENDSHGEFIFLAAESWRYTRDRSRLQSLWPRVEAAARYMDELRRSQRTETNRVPERRALFGLMPASISHEGYSDRPAYSYWDDFWALKGYEDAVHIAHVLGEHDAARRLAASRDEFRQDLYASLAASTTRHDIDFLPGAADRGDFDATSTTIALDPAGELARLPADLLHATFERYWREFIARRDGTKPWDAYTPYEWRTVGAFVRLGWSARAHELFEFFTGHRRPAGWNQWAEVVGRNAREPRFIGDMPHGWVASDFIRSTLDLFAYERPSDGALVLAAGVPPAWSEGTGIRIHNLRTPHGALSYTLRRDAGRTVLRIESAISPPQGGLVFTWTRETEPGATRVNGKRTTWSGRELRLRRLPAEVVVDDR